jgi:general secretion pathway protein A
LDFICGQLQLSLAHAGQLQKIQALHDYLLNQLQHGGSTVLIIDEAQSLGEENLEQLRMLLNLETETDKLLQIVLAGQPALESQLEQPSLYQLKQRIALWRRLTRLSDRDVGHYIAHRLQVAGDHSRGLFTSEAIQRIAQYADGIPRLIHILCDNALLNAYGTSQKTVTAEMVDEVAADHQLAALPAVPEVLSLLPPQRLRDADPEGKDVRSVTSVRPTRRHVSWTAAALIVLVLLGIGTSYALPFTEENLLEIVLERLEQLKTLSNSFWNVWN